MHSLALLRFCFVQLVNSRLDKTETSWKVRPCFSDVVTTMGDSFFLQNDAVRGKSTKNIHEIIDSDGHRMFIDVYRVVANHSRVILTEKNILLRHFVLISPLEGHPKGHFINFIH